MERLAPISTVSVLIGAYRCLSVAQKDKMHRLSFLTEKNRCLFDAFCPHYKMD